MVWHAEVADNLRYPEVAGRAFGARAVLASRPPGAM